MLGQRHNAHEAESPDSRAPRAVVAFLLAGTIIVGMILTLRGASGSEPCSNAVALTVEAAPEVAAPVRSAAAEYQKTEPTAEGRCVTVQVNTRAANETAGLLAGGWKDATAGNRPDVWIPDSTAWLDMARLQEPARALLPPTATTIATSPVVIAMPRSMAEMLDWPNENMSWEDLRTNEGSSTFWHDRGLASQDQFKVVLTNPQGSSAGASAMMSVVAVALGKPVEELTPQTFTADMSVKQVVLVLERKSGAVPNSTEALLADMRKADADGSLLDYLSAAPMPESAVFQYNHGVVTDGRAAAPKEPLVANYPADGTVVQNVPFVPLGLGGDPARNAAAQGLLDALLGETGRAAFVDAGLRAPDGSNPNLTAEAGFTAKLGPAPAGVANPAATQSAIELFRAIHQLATTLVAIDTSGSMTEPTAGAGTRTRLEEVQAAIGSASTVVAPDSNFGLWEFSRRLVGDQDYRELVKIGPMDESVDGVTRRQMVFTSLLGLKPANATGLYDTALAAFREVTAAYTPGRPNQVVLLTDGANDDEGSMSLDDLIATLRKEFDPERPVHLITIAYGAQADTAALQRISTATDAKSYPARDEESILQVVADILTER